MNLGLCNTGKIRTLEVHGWIRENQTNMIEPSRNIDIKHSPHRYFSSPCLVGVKNPRYLMFILQVQWGRWWVVDTPLASLKISARVFMLQHIWLFVNIIIELYFTNDWSVMVEWLACWLGSIGTWVRIPGPPKTLMLFFLTYSHADSKVMSTMNFTLELLRFNFVRAYYFLSLFM